MSQMTSMLRSSTRNVRLLEVGELRARVAAARDDARLEALLRELVAALRLDGVGDELHGIDLRDLLHFLDVGFADELRVLRAAALDVDERALKVDAGDLRVRHAGVGVRLRVLRGGLKLSVGDGERRREDGRHALFEFRLREFEDRLRVGVAEVVAERAVGMDVDEAGHHVLPANVDDRRLRVRLDGLRALDDLFYLLALDDDRGVLDVDAGRDDVCVYDDGLVHDIHSLPWVFVLRSIIPQLQRQCRATDEIRRTRRAARRQQSASAKMEVA